MPKTMADASDNVRQPRRRPHRNSIWPTRMGADACWVQLGRFDQMNKVEVAVPDGGGEFLCVQLTRSEARLLARRINQCLDATVLD